MVKYLLLFLVCFAYTDIQATEIFVTNKGIHKSVVVEVEALPSKESVFYVFLESDVTSRREVVVSASQAGDCLNIHVLNNNFVLVDLVSGFNVGIGGYINKDKTENKYKFVLNLNSNSGYGCSFFIFNLRGYNKPEIVLNTNTECFTKPKNDPICFRSKAYWQGIRSYNNLSVYIPSLNRYTNDTATIRKYLFTGMLESDYISYQLSYLSDTNAGIGSVLFDYVEVPTFNVRFVGRVHSFTPISVVDNLLYRWFTSPELRDDITTARFVSNFLTKIHDCSRGCL